MDITTIQRHILQKSKCPSWDSNPRPPDNLNMVSGREIAPLCPQPHLPPGPRLGAVTILLLVTNSKLKSY